MTAFEDKEVVEELARQTNLLIKTVHELSDAEVRAPSLLPAWTRAHVLAHVAQNADAFTRVLDVATPGEPGLMYPSQAARDAAIEAGGLLDIDGLRAQVIDSAHRLLATLDTFPPGRADAEFVVPAGWRRPIGDVPWFRWREVVLHHVDLGLGYGLVDAGPLVARCIDETVARFAALDAIPGLRLEATDVHSLWTIGDGETTVSGTAASLLGWLTGRTGGADVVASQAELPTLPPWA